MRTYYKGAKMDGWDWYTGNTINYRENLGGKVKVPNYRGRAELCSNTVLHASLDPNNIFIGSQLPTAVFKVTGRPVISDHEKSGFRTLRVLEEVSQRELDNLFGWKYKEVCNPVHPFKIKPPEITQEHLEQLRDWASVWGSVRASVRASVWDSVRDSVWASVWASVWDSVRDSVWASVWASVWGSVRDSVRDSVKAYIGSLFPNIEKWKYVEHEAGVYPFQPAVDLWRQGLVASYNGKVWRLHGGENAEILWEGKLQ